MEIMKNEVKKEEKGFGGRLLFFLLYLFIIIFCSEVFACMLVKIYVTDTEFCFFSFFSKFPFFQIDANHHAIDVF